MRVIRRRVLTAIIVIGACASAVPIAAAGQRGSAAPPPVASRTPQTPPAQAGAAAPQRRADPDQLTPAQVEQEFDNFALGQAQQQLGLAEAQYFRFARAYRALQMVKRRAQRERRAMMAELNALVRPPGPVADPAAVTARIAALDEQMVQSAVAARQAHVAIDGVLNLRQRARFRQFEQQMERKKLELLALAQGAARGREPPRR